MVLKTTDGIVEFRGIEFLVDLRCCSLVTHVDSCLLVLQSLDDFQDVFLHLFDVLGVDIGGYFSSQFHEESDSVSAQEGDSNPKMRVILLQLHFFHLFLDPLVNFVGDLHVKRSTAFSGKKRNNLNTSSTNVPKGIISITAST